jgi:thioredoxin
MTGPVAGTGSRITLRCQFCQSWNRVRADKAADKPKCGKCARPMLLERPVKLDDETFARTIAETDLPVFVDFYADWCGPCKIMAPFVDQLAAEYQGRAVVAKLNTDAAQKTAAGFDIRGIPTSIVFVKGKEVARQTGAVPLAGLKALLAKAGVA